jgi:hypothetical protein
LGLSSQGITASGAITEREFNRRMLSARKAKARAMKQYREVMSFHAAGGQTTGFTGGYSILRDTGTMFLALTPVFANKPGALQEDIPFGVRVGYGGPGMHPQGKATIADIASFHQAGGRGRPKREIIVPPDQHTVELMSGDVDRALAKMARTK